MNRLTLLVEASREVGMGHAMRSSALYEEAVDRGWAAAMVVLGDRSAADVLHRRGIHVRLVSHVEEWVETINADDLVVIDAYGVHDDILAAARSRGAALALIDDTAQDPRLADLLVNPDAPSSSPQGCGHMLGGFEHALIRREFRRRVAIQQRPDRLLITMGGSDPTAHAARLLDLLPKPMPFERCTFLLGPLAEPLPDPARSDVDVVRDPSDVAGLFRTATATITAAGSTALELACMGVPMSVLAVVDNQVQAADRLVGMGAALRFPSEVGTLARLLETLADVATRRSLSAAAAAAVDGLGAGRVLDELWLRRDATRRAGGVVQR